MITSLQMINLWSSEIKEIFYNVWNFPFDKQALVIFQALSWPIKVEYKLNQEVNIAPVIFFKLYLCRFPNLEYIESQSWKIGSQGVTRANWWNH